MLVTFTCEAHGDFTMFGDVAERLLKMMGHSGTIPSAIYAKDVPAVLERLKNAVESEKGVPIDDPSSDDDHMDVGGRVTPGRLQGVGGRTAPGASSRAVTDNDEDAPRVSLAGRAFPLIEMLTAAAEADCNVMWYKN